MTTNNQSRRDFIKKSSLLAAATSAVPYFAWSEPAFANESKNDRPRIGCIGVGSMGMGDAQGHSRFGDILAVCDVDQNHLEKAKADPKVGKGKADAYEDYRKVLDRNDIDVVSIVTTDHWHVKIAVEALQAGKHVFCQKPLTLTLEENQLIRNACKKYPNLVFTVGTQQRDSKDRFLRAVNMVKKGLLGKIHTVTCSIGGGDVAGQDFVKEQPPANLNWDMWLGQATINFVGGTNIVVVNSLIGARITSTLRLGLLVKMVKDVVRSQSTERMPNTRFPTKTVMRQPTYDTTRLTIMRSTASMILE
jgi:uncharacterized membrane protein